MISGPTRSWLDWGLDSGKWRTKLMETCRWTQSRVQRPLFFLKQARDRYLGPGPLEVSGHDTLVGLALASRRDVGGLVWAEMHLWKPSQSDSDCMHLAIYVSEIVKIAIRSIRESGTRMPTNDILARCRLRGRSALERPCSLESMNLARVLVALSSAPPVVGKYRSSYPTINRSRARVR
jgi:hypothetical protein